jgi:hypothetical protein
MTLMGAFTVILVILSFLAHTSLPRRMLEMPLGLITFR